MFVVDIYIWRFPKSWGYPQFYQPSILGYFHLWNPPFVYDEPGAASASGIVDTTALRSSALPGDANHRIYDGGTPISGNLDIYIYTRIYIYNYNYNFLVHSIFHLVSWTWPASIVFVCLCQLTFERQRLSFLAYPGKHHTHSGNVNVWGTRTTPSVSLVFNPTEIQKYQCFSCRLFTWFFMILCLLC